MQSQQLTLCNESEPIFRRLSTPTRQIGKVHKVESEESHYDDMLIEEKSLRREVTPSLRSTMDALGLDCSAGGVTSADYLIAG